MTLLAMRRTLVAALLAGLLQGCAGWSSWEDDAAKGPPVKPERMIGPGEYLVQRGDTVYQIAFRNSVDYRELARWNQIGSDYRIYPGQILRLKPPRNEPQRQQVGEIRSQSVDDAEVVKPRPVAADAPPLVSAPAAAPSAENRYKWVWPSKAAVGRAYGQQGNKGLDFYGSEGQSVLAAAPGRVVYSGNALQGYGELIIIKHDEDMLSAYGYNRRRHVKEGDVVTAGQPIGEMGLGPENKPLLHFEIRDKGQPTDPLQRLPKR